MEEISVVTMLDCIKRTPLRLEWLLDNWEELSGECFRTIEKELDAVNQIIFVGSGTSNTAAVTSRIVVERLSRLSCRTITPGEFMNSTWVYPEHALYVFTSQTGTSKVSRQAQQLVREKGWLTVSITESEETPLAREAGLHLNMGCGYEEHPMRTIGYSCSVLVHMLLGAKLGLCRKVISEAEYQAFLADARLAAQNQSYVIEAATQWMDRAKYSMLRAECIIFTGADVLYGVSLEGAMKVWETPRIPCFGYELEEGMHGPNYGYNSRHCVVGLNQGGVEEAKMSSLIRYMKEVHGSGLMAGSSVIDNHDLKLEIKSTLCCALEFAPVVQTIAYHLAVDIGRDMSLPHDNSRMDRYFVTHSEPV